MRMDEAPQELSQDDLLKVISRRVGERIRIADVEEKLIAIDETIKEMMAIGVMEEEEALLLIIGSRENPKSPIASRSRATAAELLMSLLVSLSSDEGSKYLMKRYKFSEAYAPEIFERLKNRFGKSEVS